jgi:FkbM family methyltransferase
VEGKRWTRVLGGPLAGSLLAVSRPERPSMVLGTYERHVMREFRRHLRPGDVAYDIGAHVGYCTHVMAKYVGPTGAVVAVEADPANCVLLRANVGVNRLGAVRIVETAVSDTVGTIEFATFAAWSSVGRIARGDTPDDANIVTVSVTTLDDLAGQGKEGPPRLIKIDVEGDEASVIRGALGVLEQFGPVVVVEARLGSTFDEIRDIVANVGYRARILNSSGANARLGVVDVLLVRDAGRTHPLGP